MYNLRDERQTLRCEIWYMLLIIIIIIITSFSRSAACNKRFSRIIFTSHSGDVVHYNIAIAYYLPK